MKRPHDRPRVLNSDIVSQAPIIELTGQCRVLIENHRGILGYSLEEVCVKVESSSAVSRVEPVFFSLSSA